MTTTQKISLTVYGNVPPKKNSRITDTRTGRSFPSKEYSRWHETASNMLAPFKLNDPVDACEFIAIKFFLPDNRRRDLTNMAESINDLLVDCGFIVDDRWQVTGPVCLYPSGIDKINPRAEIVISALKKEAKR